MAWSGKKRLLKCRFKRLLFGLAVQTAKSSTAPKRNQRHAKSRRSLDCFYQISRLKAIFDAAVVGL